jgi:Ni/Co efflux regulator RcnB
VIYPHHPFHWHGTWASPPGFYLHHWGYGDRLPWGWYTQPYWIGDYADYELTAPPQGYEWIRVGPDAVLVDLTDGTVVQTVYGAFDD